jgi:diguanylate cyclase (GGDEF)-like protein
LLNSYLKKILVGLVTTVVSFSLIAFEQQIDEQQFNSPLTIAINETSYPYHFLDEEGKADGLMVDFWLLWAKKQQVDVKFITLPWSETLKQVGEGKVDAHAGLSIVDSRKSYLNFSNSLFPLYTHVYVHSDLLHVKNMSDLAPYAVGVVNNSAHIEMLTAQYPQITQKMFLKRHDLYKAAIKKEVLAFTGLERLSDNYQYYQELSAMYPAFKRLRYRQGSYGVAVAKNNQKLLEFIELGIEKISKPERAAIEREWLGINKSKDSLSIAFPPDYPPYSAQSPTGQPQGLFIDMWKLWAKQTNTKITFVSSSIDESLMLIENNDVDVLLGFPETWLDKDRFTLASPIYNSKAKVFISNKIPAVDSLNYFERSKKKIGIWQKATFKKELLAKYPKVKFQSFPTFTSLLKAAELGGIDAFVGHVDYMNFELLKTNFKSFFYTLDRPVFDFTLSPLVKKGNDRLVRIINEGFKEIELSELVTIEERWINEDNLYYKKQLKKVTLSRQEQKFLSQNSNIDVGHLASLAPVTFIDENGDFSGIDNDILELISTRTGLNFNYIGYDSWHQLYQDMLSGEIDMLTSITPTETRRELLLFSKEYWENPWVIVHPQFIGRQSKLESFYGKELAIVKGYYLVSYLREQHPLISLKTVKDRQEGLQAVQQGKAEGFIATIASASELLKQESLVSLMMSAIEGVPPDKSHFGINKQKPYLQSIVNKGLSSISLEEKNEIHNRWFNIDINTGLDKAVVMRVALQFSLLILVILSIIIVWNRRLKAEVTQRKQLEEKMKYMATHDDLTGLANRVLLKDRINSAIDLHERQSLQIAVLFLDLDGFKNVNDNHGHDVGDELLLLVAKRLQSCVRKSDTVVRFGGDEFVLLLTGLHHANEASYVAEKVLKLLQTPFELSSTKVIIGCSIGIAMYPTDGTNDSDLLKEADTLMYQVKAAGKNHYLLSTEVNENNHSTLG